MLALATSIFGARMLLRRPPLNVRHTAWYYLIVVAVFFAAWLCWRRWPGRRARLQAEAGRRAARSAARC